MKIINHMFHFINEENEPAKRIMNNKILQEKMIEWKRGSNFRAGNYRKQEVSFRYFNVIMELSSLYVPTLSAEQIRK